MAPFELPGSEEEPAGQALEMPNGLRLSEFLLSSFEANLAVERLGLSRAHLNAINFRTIPATTITPESADPAQLAGHCQKPTSSAPLSPSTPRASSGVQISMESSSRIRRILAT